MVEKLSLVEGIKKYVLRPQRILIVEDEEGCVEAIKLALRGYDCEFTVTGNGLDAIKIVSENDFDLIFLDILLPGANGVAVLKHIKNTKPFIPVVMMSGYFDQSILDQTLQQGIVTFLRKPTDFQRSNLISVFQLFNLRPVRRENAAAASA